MLAGRRRGRGLMTMTALDTPLVPDRGVERRLEPHRLRILSPMIPLAPVGPNVSRPLKPSAEAVA
jgi:hypothetical protein